MSQKTEQTKTAPAAGSPASDVDLAAQLDALFASVSNTTSKVSAIAAHAADVARAHAATELSEQIDSAEQSVQESRTLDNDAIAAQLDDLFAHAASLPDDPPPPPPEERGPPVELSNDDIAAELAALFATQSAPPTSEAASEAPPASEAVLETPPSSTSHAAATSTTTPVAPAGEPDLASQLDALLASVEPAAAATLPEAVTQSLENHTTNDDLASQLDSLLNQAANQPPAPTAASEQAPPAPAGLNEADLASQLDSLLAGVEPANDSSTPSPVTEAAAAPEPASNDALASQLDALLANAKAEQSKPVAAEKPQVAAKPAPAKKAAPAAAKPAAAAAVASIDEIDKSLAAKSEEAIKDEIAGRGGPRADVAPTVPVEEVSEVDEILAAIPSSAAANVEATPPAAVASSTPAAGAETASKPTVETTTTVTTPHATPAASTGPGLLRRTVDSLKPTLDRLLARVNVVEAAALRITAPITAPIARATGLERTLLNAFAIYSLVVGLCGLYYAVFVRPGTFVAPRPPAFDLREDTLPRAVEQASAGEGGHGAAASHGAKADSSAEGGSSGGGEHGEAKGASKSKAKAKPGAKPGAKSKAPAKKEAEGGGGH